jgi:hypothetical protein
MVCPFAFLDQMEPHSFAGRGIDVARIRTLARRP